MWHVRRSREADSPPAAVWKPGPKKKSPLLLADPSIAEWHRFGMEWKEHVGWSAPIAATMVAFAVTYYGPRLAKKADERRSPMIFYVIGFAAAATAGVFGAFINTVAPRPPAATPPHNTRYRSWSRFRAQHLNSVGLVPRERYNPLHPFTTSSTPTSMSNTKTTRLKFTSVSLP
jgi:hypothetical protein